MRHAHRFRRVGHSYSDPWGTRSRARSVRYAYEVPPLPKKMGEADLGKEDEANGFSLRGADFLFSGAISNNDSETAWALVNIMMDRYLECREQQEGLPLKGEPKEHIVYTRKPIVPKAGKDGSVSFEEKNLFCADSQNE